MEISSLQNPRIKEAIKLRDKRDRDKTGLFLIEGYRELTRALIGSQPLSHLFFCRELFLGSNEEKLIEQIAHFGAETVSCTKEVFQKLSYRDRPDGLLAVAPIKRRGIDSLAPLMQEKRYPFFVVAEAIEKPGNLGTILRTVDAVGADALIVCDACTDVYNPNVIRASVGTLFTSPVIEASTEETLAFFKEHGIITVAATPDGDLLYTEADLRQPIAIAFGTEQYGLSERWMREAKLKVVIPMLGIADSLNVAISTGVLLYEVVRQRLS